MTERSVETGISLRDPISVMVVDDSAVIRGFLTRFLEEDPDIKVVSSVSNGELAISTLKRRSVEIIILDIEMPIMDGMTALPKLLEIDPTVEVIIASTLTHRNATITMEALNAGAAECLTKPSTSREMPGSTDFRRDLIEKTKTLGKQVQENRRLKGYSYRGEKLTRAGIVQKEEQRFSPPKEKDVQLRTDGYKGPYNAIAIGSSTGGPQALLRLFADIKKMNLELNVPIFITQHMPATFTKILADHIAAQSNLKCTEASDGDLVEAGHVYIAPGDYHMEIQDKSGKRIISLNQNEPENFCRPSVDPMLRSLVNVYGSKFLTIILTGMGQDGLKGCQKLVESGGTVLAQDKKSSVVWGMPGAVAIAGICTKIMSLSDFANEIKERFKV